MDFLDDAKKPQKSSLCCSLELTRLKQICSETKNQVIRLLGLITMSVIQPASHTVTAICSLCLILEMGSLPGITSGSLTSSPAWWGTQHASPWTRGWATKLSQSHLGKPTPAKVQFCCCKELRCQGVCSVQLIWVVMCHPCTRGWGETFTDTGLCVCFSGARQGTLQQTWRCAGGPCQSSGMVGFELCSMEETPGRNLQLQRHFY